MNKVKKLFTALKYIPLMFRIIIQVDKRFFIYMIFETICFSLMPYPTIVLVKYAMDSMQKQTSFNEYVIVCMILLAIQYGLALLKSYFNSVRPNRSSIVDKKLLSQFHQKCMLLDYQLLAEKEIHELQVLAAEFINRRLRDTVWNFIWLFSGLIALIISCAILINIDILLIIIVLGGILLNTIILAKIIPINQKLDQECLINERHINYFDSIAVDNNSAKDLRIFQLSDKLMQRVLINIKKAYKLYKKQKLFKNLSGLINLIPSHGFDLLIYIILGIKVLNDNLSIGTFSIALSNIIIFKQYFNQVSSTILRYSDTVKYVEYYNQFMSLKSHFRETGIKELSKADSFTIEFKNVSFKYPGQQEYTLKNFNVVINSRDKISVVGENGTGKSTFIKLLMRLYDPTEGVILYNNIDIREIDYDQYLSLFTTIFQDFKLFAFTIQENVSSFEEESMEKVVNAVSKSGFGEYVENLPDKYNTYFTKLFDDYGVELSGGEQQKMAIARTYYKKQASVIILDEPTSALDPKAEYLLYKQFNDLIGDNTAFFISHRLSSSRFCDKIMLIKDKKVYEFGSHSELMACDGEYASLFKLQADYYI